MKEHHRINVIRINEVRKHPNADRLEIVPIEGYQAVVAKGQFQVGDLAYYIPPDSVVPDRPEYAFIWGNEIFEGGTPERKRRIGARKFRGEWSEGVLMSVESTWMGMSQAFVSRPHVHDERQAMFVSDGDDVAEFLGITHYNPSEPGESMHGSVEPRPFKWPRTWRGWLNFAKGFFRGDRREAGISLPVYDVEAFKKYRNVFQPGEPVIVTEKIHGSNARFSFQKSFFGKGKFYVGSRQLWKAPESTCVWRRATKDNPWIEAWCRRHPGYALYGEVTPTQKGFDYGSGGKARFFLFDVRHPDGHWLEELEIYQLNDQDFGVTQAMDDGSYLAHKYFVPLLYRGPFNLDAIMKLVDGLSTVDGAAHIREGIVIKSAVERQVSHLGRAQLKIISNDFLVKDMQEVA